MDEQNNNFAAFNPLDYVSGILALGGAIAGAVTSNVAAAAFPLAGAVGCHLYNRQQLMKAISERLTQMEQHGETLIRNQNLHVVNNTEQIKLLQDSVNNRFEQLAENHTVSFNAHSQELQNLAQSGQNEAQKLQEFGENLQKRHEELATLVGELRQIETLSQAIKANPTGADIYYERAFCHHRLGDLQGAVEDFSGAIRVNARYAPAYHQRGILLSQLGKRKQAVEDLREAAKLYFDAGDLENYQKAKELAKELQDLAVTPLQEPIKTKPEIGVPDALSVGGLFELN